MYAKLEETAYYVNYNRQGQNIGHNSIRPHNVTVEGAVVRYEGDPSRLAWETVNDLVSHTIVGQEGTLYCVSEEAAEQVAQVLRENPNYKRGI